MSNDNVMASKIFRYLALARRTSLVAFAELKRFPCWPEQAIKQRDELSIIWNAKTLAQVAPP